MASAAVSNRRAFGAYVVFRAFHPRAAFYCQAAGLSRFAAYSFRLACAIKAHEAVAAVGILSALRILLHARGGGLAFLVVAAGIAPAAFGIRLACITYWCAGCAYS